jgi:hypothetical protein
MTRAIKEYEAPTGTVPIGASVLSAEQWCVETPPTSIAIVLGLEWAFDRNAEVIGLGLAQLRELHAQLL